MSNVRWTGEQIVLSRMALYGVKCHEAVMRVAEYVAPLMESFAKATAPWQDLTGNARQGLKSWVDEVSRDIVIIYLSHSVNYGIHLELRWAGKYAIIMPTITEHLPIITKMLQDIFK